MARKIRKYLTVLILVLLLGTPVLVFAQNAVEQTVQLILNSGEALKAGQYNIVVKMRDGSQETGQIKVAEGPAAGISPTPLLGATVQAQPTQASGAVQPVPATTATDSTLIILISAGALLALIIMGLVIYFRVIAPGRQLEPYHQALQLIQAKNYNGALPILTKVEGKLPDALRIECRFFIAFAKLQTEALERAMNDLENLHDEEPNNVEVTYLLAYVYLKKDENLKAEIVLDKMEKDNQLGFRDSKKLLGIVKFRRAIQELQENRVDAAEDLFEKVKQLGDFANQIPGDLREKNVVTGTKALFDKNTQEARILFDRLMADASGDPARQKEVQAIAKVGLALADWIDEKEGAGIEQLLVEAARLLDPTGAILLPWVFEELEQGDVAAKLDEVEKSKEEKTATKPAGPEKENRRMLRDIHFLRGMITLRDWGRMEGDAAYNVLADRLKTVQEQLECARELDEKFSDVYLVVGLLMFYLHKSGQEERSQGIDLLQQAQKLGMREPTALEIINNREKIRQTNLGTIEAYLMVLDKYITDQTVRQDIRLRLLNQRKRFQRVRAWEKRSDPSKVQTIEPTVAEMQHRTDILLTRVDQILSGQPQTEAVGELTKIRDSIRDGSEALVKQAQMIETNEVVLLEKTGNELFKD